MAKMLQKESENLKQFADLTKKVVSALIKKVEVLEDAIATRGQAGSSTITIKEIAKDLKISKPKVKNMIESGKIKGGKEGRRWIVFYEDYLLYKKMFRSNLALVKDGGKRSVS